MYIVTQLCQRWHYSTVGKEALFNKGCWSNSLSYGEKNNPDFYLIPYTHIHSGLIIKVNIKGKIITLLEENRSTSSWFWYRQIFLQWDNKALTIKEIIDEL